MALIMSELITKLKDIIVTAGEIALDCKLSGITISHKKDHSPVTNADKTISDYIYKKISILTPNITIICEERPLVALTTQTFWLIDPIDGTRSFIRNEDNYTVNIGLIKDGIPTIGLIYKPENRRLYYTDANNKLNIEENGKRIHNDLDKNKKDYVAVVGSHYFNRATKYFLKNKLISEVISIPSSIKLCMIAEGRADIYPRFGQTMEWDIAAGHALIIASGGDITDFTGNRITYGKPLFANPNFFALSKYWPHKLPLLPLSKKAIKEN